MPNHMDLCELGTKKVAGYELILDHSKYEGVLVDYLFVRLRRLCFVTKDGTRLHLCFFFLFLLYIFVQLGFIFFVICFTV